MLSLNASIEAARAGEFGKGFAVVAEEVGNLAHMSGKSSDEIRALLYKSKEQVEQILNQTLNKVSEGQQKTKFVSESFLNIVTGINEINGKMTQIADATREQEIGVKQISQAINQLDMLAMKNNSESEKSLAVVEEITEQSKGLMGISDKTELVIHGRGKKVSE